jgi:hypothetical protein
MFVFYHYLSIRIHSIDTEIFCVHEGLALYPMLSQLNHLKVGLNLLQIFRCHGDILDAPMSRDTLVFRLCFSTPAARGNSL